MEANFSVNQLFSNDLPTEHKVTRDVQEHHLCGIMSVGLSIHSVFHSSMLLAKILVVRLFFQIWFWCFLPSDLERGFFIVIFWTRRDRKMGHRRELQTNCASISGCILEGWYWFWFLYSQKSETITGRCLCSGEVILFSFYCCTKQTENFKNFILVRAGDFDETRENGRRQDIYPCRHFLQEVSRSIVESVLPIPYG